MLATHNQTSKTQFFQKISLILALALGTTLGAKEIQGGINLDNLPTEHNAEKIIFGVGAKFNEKKATTIPSPIKAQSMELSLQEMMTNQMTLVPNSPLPIMEALSAIEQIKMVERLKPQAQQR